MYISMNNLINYNEFVDVYGIITRNVRFDISD